MFYNIFHGMNIGPKLLLYKTYNTKHTVCLHQKMAANATLFGVELHI